MEPHKKALKNRGSTNTMKRSIIGLNKKERIRIETIKNKLKHNKRAIHDIRRRSRAGHISRITDNRWSYQTTFWYLGYKKRKKRET